MTFRTKQTKFVVEYGYGPRVARFSDFGDAMRFARAMSASFHRRSEVIAMGSVGGLIGQWDDGKSTPEFAHNDTLTA